MSADISELIEQIRAGLDRNPNCRLGADNIRRLLDHIAELEARTEWQPIETAPKEKSQFLVTDWEAGEPWACTIELVNGPFLPDGRILNQNSSNYTRPGTWKFWMPLPARPAQEPRP